MDRKPPKILLYSIVLPIMWLLLSFILLAISPEVELGIAGIFIAVNLSLFIICRHFSQSFNRQFSKNEKFRLFVYGLLWMTILRALSLYGAKEELTSQILIYAGGIVLAIDIIVIASSVFSVSNKFNKFWQKRLNSEHA